ncbi:MAG: helix-turn-helix transcriptional regulator [SAR324 cluster bacterium]|nr:helix-turn-helix transcriptional regulator [SAR324 cluster bacterium]
MAEKSSKDSELWRKKAEKSHADLELWKQETAQKEEEAQRWRDQTKIVMEGLGVMIDQQFDQWHLSPAEKEIGLLMLKGLGFKEIADVRNTSERTVRQQASEIYKKSGVRGRNEFSAFFLEDLLLPQNMEPAT